MAQFFSKKLIELWDRHQRYINLGALAVGFSFDLYLAKRPDSIPDNILLLSYLLITAAIIVILNSKTGREIEHENAAAPIVLILILQFCFGGLANNLLILYGKSGLFGGGTLFVALLGAFALGNEFLKSRYAQLRFNIVVYYFLLLTYCVIAVPTFLLHTTGDVVFLVSGVISLGTMAVFLSVIFFAVFRSRIKQLVEVSMMILFVYGIFGGLYLLNVIPPVPLVLKQIGIYHSLAKVEGGYSVTFEAPAWYVFWRDTSATYHLTSGEDAYCFSSVFAPGGLSAPIVHEWEKYNEVSGVWETQVRVPFPVSGGRSEGYRAYSVTNALTLGQWRCDVQTARGQVIGRMAFDVAEGSSTVPLSTATL